MLTLKNITIMKKVYQLNVTLDKGTHFNLLYSSYKRAYEDSIGRYDLGMKVDDFGIVTDNFIEIRYLF